MEIPGDQRLLVMNLENCIPNTAEGQVEKGGCVYAVAVASNACGPEGGAVVQIPVSMHCTESTQQHYTQVPAQQSTQQSTQTDVGNEISSFAASSDSETHVVSSELQNPISSKVDEETHCEADIYYEEIYNYLVSNIMPEGATETYKKTLHRRAQNYIVYNGMLYYGHKQSREVITHNKQQKEILKDVHIEERTGIHLGLKKMYVAISKIYFWKGLYVDVANYVKNCKVCSETAAQEDNINEESQDVEPPSQLENVSGEKTADSESSNKVWQKVELNVLGPFPRTADNNEFIIAIIDPVSHWIVARPMHSDYQAETVSSYLFTTFCTFGFTKCSFIGFSEVTFKAVQANYRNRISRVQEILPLSDLTKNIVPSVATGSSSLSLLSENLSECTWLRTLWSDFVSLNPQTWDVEIENFLFKHCASSGKEASSPFTTMFGRSPNACVEEDKENCNMEQNEMLVEKISKRRRLRSSILQCRHCEEIFTSKISFRIHQRKHTEEARRQGILEGQRPFRVTADREKRLQRRNALKRKQKLLKHGNFDHKERLMALANRKVQISQEQLPKDNRRAELEATTVDAVKKLLATTKLERKRRGTYHKYSAEIQEEIALYAMDHGSIETVKHFSEKLGRTVSESTVRNIVKLYRNFTPGLKEEIGRCAFFYGVQLACSHFTKTLGMIVRRGLVHKFRRLYLKNHPEMNNKQINSNKAKGTNSKSAVGTSSSSVQGLDVKPAIGTTKQKTMYTSELKDAIGSHACQFGISSAVEHFTQKLPCPPKASTVRKFRKLFKDKNQATQQVTMLQQLGNPINVQDAVGPSAQTIDILHTSLNILNNAQISGPTAVVYNAPFQSATMPQVQSTSHLIPSSNSSNTVPLTFHTVNSSEANVSSTMSYHQPTPITASVIMNQNPVSFSQSPIPIHGLYSSFSNQGQINDKSAIVTVPQSELAHHSISHVPASSIPTITFAIASPGQQNFQNISTHPTVVMPHRSQSGDASNLSSQPSILVSHEPNGTTVVQQLMTSPFSHTHLHEDQQQPRELPQPLSHDIMNSNITNPSQVLVQQPSVIAEPLLINQETLPSDSQIVEQHNLESATYLHTLKDAVPFDTTGSTLIADRDGTYSLATAVSNDVSITVEKDPLSDEETLMNQTQETQTPEETDEVVISVVSQNVSERTESESAFEASDEGMEETNFLFVKSEEDVDDPEIPKAFLRKKRKTLKGGLKRGNYTLYSPEIRAEMGKYAAEHGSHKASQYFRFILGHIVPESTIRGLRDKYLLKRENCVSSSGKDKEITALGYAPRGRPMRLGKYDEVVQDCIRQLIKSGEKVTSFLAITTAKQVLTQFEPGLLEENGGKVKLNMTWAKSFMKRIGVQNNS